MPNIYLEHPKHGQKVAHSVLEAQGDKANGWVEFDPSDRATPTPEPEQVIEPVVPDFLSLPEQEVVPAVPVTPRAPKLPKPRG